VDPLLPLLEHENEELRSAAFESLCSIGGDSARVVEAVVRFAEREDGGTIDSWEFGLRSLFENVTGPGAEALAAVIKDGDREVVTNLLSIFKKNQSLQGAPLVMEAIRTVEQRNQ
jgi:HEAT repeat protein